MAAQRHMPNPMPDPTPEWFDRPDHDSGRPGLRFECTMCGACCSGPEGYVLINGEESRSLAAHLGVPLAEFHDRYIRDTEEGPSLVERPGPDGGLDCVFLDRESVPGKAVCGVYEHRPAQCRTWPFWRSNLATPQAWRRAAKVCPGMNRGALVAPEDIRILRAKVEL